MVPAFGYSKLFKIKYPRIKTKPHAIFNSNNVKRQICFPSPLLSYILKSANAAVLKKLQKTCKYFYAFEPIHLCKNIFVNTKTLFRIDRDSIYLPSFDTKIPSRRLKNVYLTRELACYDEYVETLIGSDLENEAVLKKINRKFVSLLIPQLHKCDVEYLYIPHQDLTLKEFEFLISSGRVKKVDMQDTTVSDENGKKLPHVRIQMIFHQYRCQLDAQSRF